MRVNEDAELVRSLFGSILQVGEARTSGPLTLAPLFGALSTAPYLLASEAANMAGLGDRSTTNSLRGSPGRGTSGVRLAADPSCHH
jgi:hypothetical protein